MNRVLRGGIIGCGFFARQHIEAWRRIPDASIIAAADPQFDRAQAFARRAYRSAEEMLEREELDFVDIVARVEKHLALVKLATEKRSTSSARSLWRRIGQRRWKSCVAP